MQNQSLFIYLKKVDRQYCSNVS